MSTIMSQERGCSSGAADQEAIATPKLSCHSCPNAMRKLVYVLAQTVLWMAAFRCGMKTMLHATWQVR
jgi:hypothetical protein